MATWSIVHVHTYLHIFKIYVLVALQDFIKDLLHFSLLCVICLFVYMHCSYRLYIVFAHCNLQFYLCSEVIYRAVLTVIVNFFSAPGPSLYWLVQLWRDRGWAQVHSGKMYREQHQLEKRRGRFFGESKDHQTLWCRCCSDGIWRGRTGKGCGWE